jgi:signal transduction histidine kinase
VDGGGAEGDGAAEPGSAEAVLRALLHDLRSPLRAISNFAVLGEEADDVGAILDRIAGAAAAAHSQLDGALVHLEVGPPGPVEPVEPAEVVRSLVGDAVPVVVEGASVSVASPPSLRTALAVLVADAEGIAGDDGPDELRVAVLADPPPWRVQLTVPGRGVLVPGPAPGFAPFRWSDGSRTDGPMGPLLARRLVAAWGGRLSATAERGRSTTWTVTGPG